MPMRPHATFVCSLSLNLRLSPCKTGSRIHLAYTCRLLRPAVGYTWPTRALCILSVSFFWALKTSWNDSFRVSLNEVKWYRTALFGKWVILPRYSHRIVHSGVHFWSVYSVSRWDNWPNADVVLFCLVGTVLPTASFIVQLWITQQKQ